MSLSRVKTWVADEVLTASNLNAEFNNILNNALSLISPLTGALDFNGLELILDADGDSSITADTDDRIDFRVAGGDSMFIGHASGNTAGFVTVDPLAFTATAATNIARLMVAGTNALTVPAGTTAIAAGLHVAEPNLTATGTITSAVSLYVAAAPTEGGTNNYALWVDAGATQLDGAVVMASTLNVTGAVDVTGTLTVASNIIHQGDTNNLIAFTTDAQSFETGGSSRIDISDTGVRLGAANARVTTVLDEDAMGSDSATALATQQSIKAYADSTSVTQADQAAVEAETNENTYVPPDLIVNNPGVAKAWGIFTGATGSATASFNSTTARNGAGDYTITIVTDMSSDTYVVQVSSVNSAALDLWVDTLAVGSFNIKSVSQAGTPTDGTSVMYVVYGDR